MSTITLSDKLAPDVKAPLEAIKETLEITAGIRPGATPLPKLGPSATLSETINAYEALRRLLQPTGPI